MKNRDIEDEANYFAMCLLMPEDLLRQEADKLEWDLGSNKPDPVKQLAKIFDVPLNAMVVRLSQINYFK